MITDSEGNEVSWADVGRQIRDALALDSEWNVKSVASTAPTARSESAEEPNEDGCEPAS